jgi:hypothetical protein
MEELNQHTQEHNIILSPVTVQSQQTKKHKPFIEANTLEVSFEEVNNNHIIPVFVKDNEPLISHAEFIETTRELTWELFNKEDILFPEIRVSHPVKGRIPEAKDKPAQLLEDWEKTLYYERMAFIIEIPSICEQVGGNTLSLTIGGVKTYHLDNLYSRTASDQHFKVFIGFRNMVCTNLCVSTDGYLRQASVRNIDQLRSIIKSLLQAYQPLEDLKNMSTLCNYALSETQFAQLVGRCRMYNYLPSDLKADIQPLLFGDQMINTVVKDFYRDNSFCRDQTGDINLWKLYNLFTGANKASYIDSFLDRSVNASTLVQQLRYSIKHKAHNWYLN